MGTNRKSERELAALSGLSRGTVRKLLSQPRECKVRTLELIAQVMESEFDYSIVPKISGDSECSVACASLKIRTDGFESWRLHIMNFVDEFRRSLDRRLVILPPVRGTDERILALFSGIVQILCNEANIGIPGWAKKKHYCAKPWFLSGSEALKASAILESPIELRSQNIYAHDNFLSRV